MYLITNKPLHKNCYMYNKINLKQILQIELFDFLKYI